MKILRPYQRDTNNRVRAHEEFGPGKLNVQAPTGAGKGIMIADLLQDKLTQLLLTHRRVLLDMLDRVLNENDVPHGIIAAGHKLDLSQPIQLAMDKTLFNRAFKKNSLTLPRFDRILIDELHSQQGDNTYLMLQRFWDQGGTSVGFTATPSDIGTTADTNLIAAQVHELINDGFLVPPVVFGPDSPDMEKLERVSRQVNGEYSLKGLDAVWDSKIIFGSVLDNLLLLNPTLKPTILFAQGVPHSLWYAQTLSAAGIPSAHIDGENVWVGGCSYTSDRMTRDAVFRASETGEIKVICNRFVMREGVDLPWLQHCINACVFGTRKAWVQSNGRILRTYPGKAQATVQDHGGNWITFPDLDSDDPWDLGLSDRVASQMRIADIRDGKLPEPICCSSCKAIRVSGDTCPVCNFKSPLRIRSVMQLDGSLKLVTGAVYRKQRITKTKNDAQTYAGLYYGNLKYHPDRTPAQIRAYHAYKNGWHWLPKDLPLMPIMPEHWFTPVGKVPREALR